jgi:ABC-type branched-subunit amino acid transport system substrate-binding protein
MPMTNRNSIALYHILNTKGRGVLLGLLITLGLLFSGCAPAPMKPISKHKVEAKDKKPKKIEESQLTSELLLLQKANQLAEAGDSDQAARYYRQIVETYPYSSSAPEAYTKLAEYLLRQGSVSEAIILLEEAVGRPNHVSTGLAYLLLGEAHHHQENLQKAWMIWGRLAQLEIPEAAQGWRQLLDSYFNFATPESTPIMLNMIPPAPLSAEQARVLFQVASLQSRRQIDLITNLQPSNSPLLPQLILEQGDQAIRAGDALMANTLWTRASLNPLTMQEAQYRLKPQKKQPPFRIGLILPLSGRHKKLANNLLHAAQKALADYRDVPISLIIADSGGTPETAMEAVNDLHRQNASIIIGPVLHELAKQAAVQAVSLQIPIMVLNHRNDVRGAGGQVYQNTLNPQRQARIMAHYAVKEREFARIAILAPDSNYGHLMADTFANEVTALNGQIVRSTFFDQDSPDFTPWIKALVHLDSNIIDKRLRRAKKTTPLDPSDPLPPTDKKDLEAWADFDAIFLPTLAKQIRLIAPQAAFYNIRSPQVTLLGTSRWNRQSLFEGGTEYLQGAVFLDTDRQLRDQFRMAFRQDWEEDPTSLASLTYDGVSIIAQLLREERMGGVDWQIRLAKSNGFTGAAGRIQFQDSGASQRPYRLFTVARRGVTTIPLTKNTKQILSNRNAVVEIPVAKEVEY